MPIRIPVKRANPSAWLRVMRLALLLAVVAGGAITLLADDPEIALDIDEPWEDMRKRSTAKIASALPDAHWFRVPKSNARLRFIDPQYGFITPVAKFFTIGFDDDRTRNVRMSPQTEPLLLDDALKVLLDLQCQFVTKGWTNRFPEDYPLFADTPQWRERFRDQNKGGKTYWQAADRYRATLRMYRFKWSKRPEQERYLITLELFKP
ncbi:hypothetical protein [Pseudomonas sp. v388]|uniref:hypothetical protein n=1 Tax=Pseudomonas sp. v388 TaxID=2479849 RepID=UPI0021147E0B|nr:hypothetical protein [Pseudomonas sp. v388]